MSGKKRVYDIAKQYGMTGQELAAKLRDLGFSQVKSHMTALDDFLVLEIQARLEAYGYVGESAGQGVQTVGGLKIKRKKKKSAPESAPTADDAADDTPEDGDGAGENSDGAVATDDPGEEVAAPQPPTAEAATADPAPAATPVSEAELAPSASERTAPEESVATGAPAASQGPEPEVASASTAPETTPAPAASTPNPTAAQPAAGTPEAIEPTPRPGTAASKQELRPRSTASEVAESPSTEAPARRPAAAASKPAGEAPAAPGKPGNEVIRPSAKRRTGKVVGFIDPSQFQKAPERKNQSRRLRSSDDVVPDVMPTFGRDRHSGQVRGDQTRGSLTAQQLREREQGRFLRRRRVQQQSGPGGRRGGGRHDGPSGSPFDGTIVTIDAPVTIKKLANTLAVKENQVMRSALSTVGFGITINSVIDEDTAVLLAHEFGVDLEVREEVAAETQLLSELEEKRKAVGEEHLMVRGPSVAVLGHVDHGKTTLIDTIRRSRITSGEAGGITQHIGAYRVQTKSGHWLTVVDTPGHAAFTAMRSRGASAVDVVILVVAADDGMKPQTEEALNHARAAGTPIIVALNKMDKPEANPDRVRNELASMGLTPEEWGGETAMLQVSGLEGTGVDELLERVFLESEVLELKCHKDGPASGVVLEAEIQQGKGKVAHLIIQDGSLKKGDVILAGEGYGKVRSIHDDHGKQLLEAGPSMPVEVTGLNELPTVGDSFYVVESLDRAQEVASERARTNRQLSQIERRQISRDNILEAVADQDRPQINLIVKADMQGSVEVIKHQLSEFTHDDVEVKLIHSGVGAVLESDVDLAFNSDARIMAFHTSANTKVRQAADRNGVDIKVYTVIYELLDDVRRLMEGELAPEYVEEITGHVEIRRIFKSSKLGNIAGCYVLDGVVNRNSKVRLLRDSNVVYTGTIGSLRRESDDTKEVRADFECGIVLKDFDDVKEGDVVETFKINEIKRTL